MSEDLTASMREIGALEGKVDSLVREVDVRIGTVEANMHSGFARVEGMLRLLQESESRSPDRSLSVLGLIASLLVPSIGLMGVFVLMSGDPLKRDLYWMEKIQDVAHVERLEMDRLLEERSVILAKNDSFIEEQRGINARNDRAAELSSSSASADKDELERAALAEIRESVRDLAKQWGPRIERIENALGYIRFQSVPENSGEGGG